MTIMPISRGLIPCRAANVRAIGAMIATAAGESAPMAVSSAVTKEHDPGDGGDVAADELHRPTDQQVDGAVVLRDREQVGDPDQRQHQLRGEAAKDLVG